jgi:hypothetical protein
VRLAVAAHIRHRETDYDKLLAQGYDRGQARAIIAKPVLRTLESWRSAD